MGTRVDADGSEKVYNAAVKWVEAALRTDGSLFAPGESIWSSTWLGELHQRFLDHPDESNAKFLGSVVNLRISVSKRRFPSSPRKREPGIR